MSYNSARNKLYDAYKTQEENRNGKEKKSKDSIPTEVIDQFVTTKENVIYDTGWIKSVDGGTLIDDGLRVSNNDSGKILEDSTTVGTFVQLFNSKRSNFTRRNETGYNNVAIGFRKEIHIPENQLLLVDYAIVMKPIPESKITYLTQYQRSVYDPQNLIKISGDGSLICYAYVSSSTLPIKWDKNYYDKGYLKKSKTSKWYDIQCSTTNANDGRKFVYTGSLYGVIVQWNFVKHIDPLHVNGFAYTYEWFQGDAILSVNGNTVKAKGRYIKLRYNYITHEVETVVEDDRTKTVSLTLPDADIWVKMDGTRVIDGEPPTGNNPGQLQQLQEDSSGYYYPTARWINPAVSSSEFINKYRVWYSTEMKNQVILSSGVGANWKLINLPTSSDYYDSVMPYTKLELELNPKDNPLPIQQLDSGYSYDYNMEITRLGADDEIDELGRRRYQLNLFKSFLYTAKASEKSETNRIIVDESYTSNGGSYDYDGENRGTKDLDIFATPLAQIEFKIVVFLKSNPKYSLENKIK